MSKRAGPGGWPREHTNIPTPSDAKQAEEESVRKHQRYPFGPEPGVYAGTVLRRTRTPRKPVVKR